MKQKADPTVQAAEKAIDKAIAASEKAKEAIAIAAADHSHPRQLNKTRAAVQDSFESLHRGKRWIGRWKKIGS